MGKRFEKFLKKIPKGIQKAALEDLNKAREVFGGKPIAKIPRKGANNHIGGCSTPVGLCLKDLMTPKYDDGSGFQEIDGIYTSVWEVSNADIGQALAQAWDTEYKEETPLNYCCHRHFENEKSWVVVVPKSIRSYESAVVDAADDASRCACGCAWYERDRCSCGYLGD